MRSQIYAANVYGELLNLALRYPADPIPGFGTVDKLTSVLESPGFPRPL